GTTTTTTGHETTKDRPSESKGAHTHRDDASATASDPSSAGDTSSHDKGHDKAAEKAAEKD
ncbi:MAG: hypothetical protein QOJ95_1482, partial [Mycobacterium sp.]|nr:hypothetical protein [Mycobacterium sp.]